MKSKTIKLAIAFAALFAFLMCTDYALFESYAKSRPDYQNWMSIERYLLAAISIVIFLRGVTGLWQDKACRKQNIDTIMGYVWSAKVPTFEFVVSENYQASPIKTGKIWKFALLSLLPFIVVIAIIGLYEMLIGSLDSYRTGNAIVNVALGRGINLFGFSEFWYNIIGLVELLIQSVFVYLFMRGTIGFYHDYLLSKKQNRAIAFDDIELKSLGKLCLKKSH